MNKLNVVVLVLMSTLWLSGCGALLVGGAATGGYYVGKDDRSLGRITDDATITSSINAKYVRDDLVKALDINVDTYNGVVTLYGNVKSGAAAARAVHLAKTTRGVAQVISRLTVASGG